MTVGGGSSGILDRDTLEYFFNSVDDHFGVLDVSGCIVRANAALRRFLAPAGCADNAKLSLLMFDSCRETFESAIRDLEPDQTVKDLFLKLRINQQVFKVKASLTRTHEGTFCYAAQDITQQETNTQFRKEMDMTFENLEDMIGMGRWRREKGQPAHWTKGMYRMFGLDPMLGPPSFDEYLAMMPLEDARQIKHIYEESRRENKAISTTINIKRPNGDARVIEIAGMPIKDSDGRFQGFSGVALDRTNDLEALRTTLTVNDSTQLFLDQAPYGVLLLDNDERIAKVNKAMLLYLRKSENSVLNRKITQIWPKLPEEMKAAMAAASAGKAYDCEMFPVEVEGKQRWVAGAATPWVNPDGQRSGVLFLLKDRTKTVLRIRTAEAGQQAMSRALSVSQMLVWQINVKDKHFTLEGDWQTFFAQKPGLKQFSDSVFKQAHVEDRPNVVQAWKKHLQTYTPLHLTYRLQDPKGEIIWVSLTAEHVLDDQGAPIALCGTMRNITGFLQSGLHSKISAGSNQITLASGYEIFEDTGSKLLEDVKSIREDIQSVRSNALSDEALIPILKKWEGTGERMAGVLRDMQFYSALTRKPVPDDVATFDLNEDLKPRIEAKVNELEASGFWTSVQLEFGKMSDICVGSLQRLDKIVKYALHHMCEQGSGTMLHLAVRADCRERGVCVLAFDICRNSQDTMAQTDIEQVSSAGNEDLTFAILYSMINQMGGGIWRGGHANGAYKLSVRLPLNLAQTEDKASSLVQVSPEGMTILVAEDNPINRRGLSLIASYMNLNMTFVENGQEALAAVKSGQFDAAIIDTQMPIMSGLTAIREIRAWEKEWRMPHIPILAAIPQIGFAKVREAISAGADDCIAKPISQEDLIDQLSDLRMDGWKVSSKIA